MQHSTNTGEAEKELDEFNNDRFRSTNVRSPPLERRAAYNAQGYSLDVQSTSAKRKRGKGKSSPRRTIAGSDLINYLRE